MTISTALCVAQRPWTVPVLSAVGYLVVSIPKASRDFLQYVVRTYFDGNQTALAAAMGKINRRSVGRLLAPKAPEYLFNVENCLRLARALQPHFSASYVLTKMNRPDLATVLEQLYGRPTLSAAEETHLAQLEALDPASREAVLRHAAALAAAARHGHAPPDSSAQSGAGSGARPGAGRATARGRKR